VSFEIGIHLGNAHPQATAASVTELAVAAEELGFDAIWMTEHIVVGGDVVERYGNVVHPLPALSFLAGRTARVALGTSVIVAPLHDPFMLAKLTAGIQDLSGGRLRLGLGAGWYEPEFTYMNRSFVARGRRLDESIALMRALWRGDRVFDGEFWRCDDARFGPLPAVAPEIWIGGASRAAAARASRLGVVWHPIALSADEIARAKDEWPELRVVPRVTADGPDALARAVDRLRAAGADGVAAGSTSAPARAIGELQMLAELVAV
jgi:probable F420-dependent oxidoreductase